MSEEMVIKLVQEALFYMLLISAPMLGVSLIVGLIVSIFQTATAIQEMTLTFVPKIIATLLTISIFGLWMLKTLVEYTTRLIMMIPDLVG
ncbi:MAG: flagellar biosynthesis protein FliQ [bacterium]